jgi:hypothetical protein
LCTYVQRSIVNIQKVENTQMLLNWRMNRYSVLHPWNDILSSHRKRDGVLVYSTTWMKLEIMLNERN